MSRVPQPLLKSTKKIEIVLSGENYVYFMTGGLQFHVDQGTFQDVELLLWKATSGPALMKAKLNTSSAVTCRSKRKKP